jgi:monoamine oxidase
MCCGDLKDYGYLSPMMYYALGGHDHDRMSDFLFGHSFKDGVVTLANAMLEDSDATLRLSTPVTAVSQSGHEGIRVTTDDGESITARGCVVAIPSACWVDVQFTPPLSENRLRVSRQRALVSPKASTTKAVIKGERREISIVPPASHPIGFLYTDRKRTDDVQIIHVDEHPAMKNAADPVEMTAAIHDLLPHVEVLELLTETYYPTDRFCRGGWAIYRAGALTREEPPERLSQPEGQLVFAGAEISSFFYPCIDGAIETGLRAGRQIRTITTQP